MTGDPRETHDGVRRWDADGPHPPAWEDFYRTYYMTALRTAVMFGTDSATAQDAVQEAFIALRDGLGRVGMRTPCRRT